MDVEQALSNVSCGGALSSAVAKHITLRFHRQNPAFLNHAEYVAYDIIYTFIFLG